MKTLLDVCFAISQYLNVVDFEILVGLDLPKVFLDEVWSANERRDVFDGNRPGDLEARVAHLQPDREAAHQEDRTGKHQESSEHVNPQDPRVLEDLAVATSKTYVANISPCRH